MCKYVKRDINDHKMIMSAGVRGCMTLEVGIYKMLSLFGLSHVLKIICNFLSNLPNRKIVLSGLQDNRIENPSVSFT